VYCWPGQTRVRSRAWSARPTRRSRRRSWRSTDWGGSCPSGGRRRYGSRNPSASAGLRRDVPVVLNISPPAHPAGCDGPFPALSRRTLRHAGAGQTTSVTPLNSWEWCYPTCPSPECSCRFWRPVHVTADPGEAGRGDGQDRRNCQRCCGRHGIRHRREGRARVPRRHAARGGRIRRPRVNRPAFGSNQTIIVSDVPSRQDI